MKNFIFSLLFIIGISYGLNSFSQAPELPMNIVYENSLEATWLAKEVKNSKLLDAVEDLSTWTHYGYGSAEITGERAMEGKKSLRMHFSAIRPKDAADYSYPNGGIRIKLNSEDWSTYNRISIWVYPELKNARFLDCFMTFTNAGDTATTGNSEITTRNEVLMEPGKWNHVVWEIADLPRNKVTGFSFNHMIAGKQESGIADSGYLDFDRFEIQTVDPDHFEGWKVSPGKIAFSHTGYETGEEKTAIASDIKAVNFSVVQLTTGKTVLEKAIKDETSYIGTFRVMDFSEVREEGMYILKAGDTSTRPFKIGSTVWKETAWKNLNLWYSERCGIDVPGVHDDCHRDQMVKMGDSIIVINGGWHDAGDLAQMIYNTGPATYAMFSLAEKTKETDKYLYKQLMEEGKWGLEWLLRSRFGNGYRLANSPRFGRWTDNIIGTYDDRTYAAKNAPFENFIGANVEAFAAKALKDYDLPLSDQCLRAAAEDWDAAVKKITGLEVEVCGEAIMASMNLYDLTGDKKYTDKAILWADAITQSQQQAYPDWKIPLTGFFYKNSQKVQALRYNPISQDHAPVMALEKLCHALPDHPNWMNWYASIVLYAEYLKKTSEFTSPYNMFPSSVYHVAEQHKPGTYGINQSSLSSSITEGKEKSVFELQVENGMELGGGYYLRFFPVWTKHRGNLGILLAQAKSLAVASHLRNDLKGINTSRKQLEWMIGKNPFCQSTMYGEGYDFSPMYSQVSGHIVGAIPVGIMTHENKDVPYWPPQTLYNYKEIWANPAARWLWLLEDVSGPAKVSGRVENPGSGSMLFTETQTGTKFNIPIDKQTGLFSSDLPEGIYTAMNGAKEKKITVLPSGTYELDFRSNLDFTITAEESRKKLVKIKANVINSGPATFEIRVYNLKIKNPIQEVKSNGKPLDITWDAEIIEANKPWIAVIIPNGDINELKEVNGIRMGDSMPE